jgi:hypothetical protein
MTISITPLGAGALELVVDGELHRDDYLRFRRVFEERLDRHGSVNLLIRIRSFDGFSPAAIWEDLKFDAAHYRDVSKLALVDDGANARWIAWVSKPFTGARIEHFNVAEIEQARAWIGVD